MLNLIRFPLKSYVADSAGNLVLEETIDDISQLPFRWGWPFHFIVPDTTSSALTPVPIVAGTAATKTIPAKALWHLLALNVIVAVFTIVALVYCLQKLFPRFSIMTMMAVTVFFALPYAIGPLIAETVGDQWAVVFANFLYFWPIPVAVAIVAWQRSGLDWNKVRDKASWFGQKEPNDESPEDVLSLASKLDQEGNWEEALKLYRTAAQRWPEQAGYIENCIAAIEAKKSV